MDTDEIFRKVLLVNEYNRHAIDGLLLRQDIAMLVRGARIISCTDKNSTFPCVVFDQHQSYQNLNISLVYNDGKTIASNLPGIKPFVGRTWPAAVSSDGSFAFPHFFQVSSRYSNIWLTSRISKFSVKGLLKWTVDAEQLIPFDKRDATLQPNIEFGAYQLDVHDNLYVSVRQSKEPRSIVHHIFALSANGKLLWRHPMQELNAEFTPYGDGRNGFDLKLAVGSDTVYVGTPISAPIALQLSDGREKWRLSDPDGVSEMAVCTNFLLLPKSGNTTSLIFGDCVGRLWSFTDTSQPPQPPVKLPIATSTAAITSSSPLTSAAPPSSLPIPSSTSSPPLTSTNPSSSAPPSTSTPPLPYQLLVEVHLSCPSILNFTLLAHQLLQLLRCPRPVILIASEPEQSGGSGWIVTVAMLPECATRLHDQAAATADHLSSMGVSAVDPAASIPAAPAQLSIAAIVVISVAVTVLLVCAMFFLYRKCCSPSGSVWANDFSLISYLGCVVIYSAVQQSIAVDSMEQVHEAPAAA